MTASRRPGSCSTRPFYQRRFSGAGTDAVNADAPGRILESGGLGQPDDPMLRGGISSETGQADEAALRRAVYDGAATLLAHLPQLMLHAGKDAAQIDRDDPVEIAAFCIGGFRHGDMDAGVIESRIETPEGGYGLCDHGRRVRLVLDGTADADRLVASGDQLVGCGPGRILIDVRDRYRRAGFGKRSRGCQADARRPACDESHLVFE